jgi:D-3-phosphoglycerate dehydrogenase
MSNLLYIYEKRHPIELIDFIRSRISKQFSVWEEATYSDEDSFLINKFSEANAVLMAPGRYLSDEVHNHGKKIKLIQLWSSGYDKINLDACRKNGQKVANNGGANSNSVAEHTLLLILAAAKRITEMHDRVINAKWIGNGHGLNLQSLFGKNLGIIGMGNIGSKVAKLATAFDMKVLYFDPYLEQAQDKQYMKCEFKELLQLSDFISLHLHKNPETAPLIGEKEIDLMKSGVNIINTSRAGLIEMSSLKKSLDSGKVRYYASDVFTHEPTLGKEIELSMNNVTFSPHIAGSNLETYQIALDNCIKNIINALNDNQVLWEV